MSARCFIDDLVLDTIRDQPCFMHEDALPDPLGGDRMDLQLSRKALADAFAHGKVSAKYVISPQCRLFLVRHHRNTPEKRRHCRIDPSVRPPFDKDHPVGGGFAFKALMSP